MNILLCSWKSDEEFGRQMLNGVNPTTLSRCDELPDELKHAEEQIFGDKTTCSNEIKVICVGEAYLKACSLFSNINHI